MNNDLFVLYGVDLSPDEMKKKTREVGIAEEFEESDLEAMVLRRVEKLSKLVDDKFVLIDDGAEDVVAHLALRMISASDETGRVETWFINNECSALRNKLTQLCNANRDGFLTLLKRLLFVNVLYLDEFQYLSGISARELSKRTGVNASKLYVVVDWKAVPKAVHDKAILYKGLAVIQAKDSILISQAVKNYELLLREKIYALSREVTVESIERNKKTINRILENIQANSTSFVGLEHLEEETNFFPSCMRVVDLEISKGMELERSELLQMGFFLREAGMSLNDYLRYWYLRHPKNADKSWEEFLGSHWGRYELPHHYGEVGGGKKYSSMACQKIQGEGICPFKDWSFEKIEAFLKSYLNEIYPSDANKEVLEKGLSHIRAMCKKRFFGAACSTEFKLRFKVEKHDYVNHPIYLYFAKAKLLARPSVTRSEQATQKSNSK